MSTIDEGRMAVANQKLLSAMLKGSIESVMQAAHEIFNAPVFAINAAGKFICQIPNAKIGHAKWDKFIEERVVEFGDSANSQKFFNEHVSQGHKTVHLDNKKNYSGVPCIMGRFYEHSIIAGHVAIYIFPPDREPSETEMAIADLLCDVLSALYTNSSIYSSNMLYHRYIVNLLSGDTSPDADSIFVMNLEPILKKDYLVLVSPIPAIYLNNSLASFICDNISKQYDNTLHAVYEDNLIIVCCHLTKSASKNPCCSTVINNLLTFLAGYNFTTGISSGFSDIKDLKGYYEQARITVALGMKLNPQKKVHLFYEYSPLHLLYPISQLSAPEIFIHPIILAMRNYDRDNNTEYLRTYKVYITCNESKRIAADALHIHINTLNYRLKKIDDFWAVRQLNEQDKLSILCSLLLSELIF